MLFGVGDRRWREYWINSDSVEEREMLDCLYELFTYLMAFSSMAGMSLARYGEESSRQGFVLTSIIQGFISSSIMKS